MSVTTLVEREGITLARRPDSWQTQNENLENDKERNQTEPKTGNREIIMGLQ